jgi:hypothetical protein
LHLDRAFWRTSSGEKRSAAPEETGHGQEAGVSDHAVVRSHGLSVDVPPAVEYLDRAGLDPASAQ